MSGIVSWLMSGIARTARTAVGGFCYLAMNRGNSLRQVFHHQGEYADFAVVTEGRADSLYPLISIGPTAQKQHVIAKLTIRPLHQAIRALCFVS